MRFKGLIERIKALPESLKGDILGRLALFSDVQTYCSMTLM